MTTQDSDHAHAHAHDEDDSWWDDKVEALVEEAEAHYGNGEEEGAADRYLMHLRILIDTAIEQLQSFALHNPCGDGETIELKDGVEACAGCFDAEGNPRT